MRGYAILLVSVWSVVAHAQRYWAREDVAEWSFQDHADHCLMTQVIPDFGSVSFDQGLAQPLVLRVHSILDLSGVHRLHMARESTPWQPASPAVVSEVAVMNGEGGHALEFGSAPAETALETLESSHQLHLTPDVLVLGGRADVIMQPVRMHDALLAFRACRLAQTKKEQVMAAQTLRQPSAAPKVVQHEAPKPNPPVSPPQKDVERSIHSPYQDWLKQHEAGHHGLPVVTRGHDKSGLPTQVVMHFATGKSSISKALQDQMESIVKEWEIRRGEKRSMSLLLQGGAVAGQEVLVLHRLDAVRSYLLARGMPASRVHVRVNKMAGAHQPDDINVTVGD